MEKLKISVIMLTYNRETLVSRAIESILNQTFTNFEFIIINNGSTDNSGRIASEYAQKDKRISVINHNGNIGSGRNAGLNAATGEYIAFIDDDDWCEPDFLEFLYALAAENNADVSICGATGMVYNEKLIMSAEEALTELMWRKRYNMAFPTKMFRHELAKNLRFPEQGKYDDIALMYRLLARAKKVAYWGLPKYTFYRHGGNNSAWTTNHNMLTNDILDEYLQSYRERTEWLCNEFPGKSQAWKYFELSFMISMVEKINRLGIKECERECDNMLKELRAGGNEFLGCGYVLDFEREWFNRYVVT